jgi:flagellar biosynthesis GTPase FlhF
MLLKEKVAAKLALEKEKERQRSEEQKKLQEKRKEQAEALAQRKLQEQKLAEKLKKQEHLEREMEKHYIRTMPLGKDRFHNRFWFFFREGRLFVESDDCKRWGYYSAKEELDALFNSLNVKGIREKALHKQMETVYGKIRLVASLFLNLLQNLSF